jgi:hypothetical protein
MYDSAPIPWLLAARTPSIRYLTLRCLLGRSEEDADVRAARREMAASGPIPAILARQTGRGNWANERSYYSPKYTSTHWSMTLLVELAADPADERLRRGAEFMLAVSAADTGADVARAGHGWVCFWGNLLRYALYCGFDDDPRVARLTDRVVRDATEAGWRCRHNDELPCAWGAARALWGLAALPEERRSPEVAAAIASGLALLLEGDRLVRASYPTSGTVHEIWRHINFPLFYQADILFVLRVAAELGALDHPGARLALAWLAQRRRARADGTWQGTNPFRTPRGLWDQEETDRWVMLHAAIVLDAAGSTPRRLTGAALGGDAA